KMPERQWLARFDRELPQRELALFPQGNAQKIGFTYRYATGRQYQVDILQLAKASTRRLKVIRKNSGVDHFTAQALQPAAEQPSVAVVDLARPKRLTRFNQFIAGGEYRNADLANHIQLGASQ